MVVWNYWELCRYVRNIKKKQNLIQYKIFDLGENAYPGVYRMNTSIAFKSGFDKVISGSKLQISPAPQSLYAWVAYPVSPLFDKSSQCLLLVKLKPVLY